MRKFTQICSYLLIFAFALLSNALMAQYQLPNSTFDEFETGFNGEGQQPTGWKGSNVVQTVAGITARGTLVNSDNNGHTGKCVYLHNEEVGAMGITAPAPAFIALGTPWNHVEGLSANQSIGGCIGGLNFTHRPDTLILWIKRTTTDDEIAHVTVYLWSGSSYGTAYRNKKGDCQTQGGNRVDEEVDIRGTNTCTTTQTATLIGQGEWTSGYQQFPNWTEVKIPINYLNNAVPENINVIISAANYPCEACSNSIKVGSKLWADDLRLGYSSKITELRINNRPLISFNSDVYEYDYPLETGEIPQITAYRNGRQLNGTEILITNGSVGVSPAIISVTAEDDSSTTIYKINFIPNTKLGNIFIDGEAIENFNPNITNYYVQRDFGSNCPEIEVEKAEQTQTYTISNCNSVPSSAVISVFAENPAYFQTYTINFIALPLIDNRLQNILIKGASLENFDPDKLVYNLQYPSGTAVSQLLTNNDVSVVKANENQSVEISQSTDYTILITLTNGDGITQTFYVITQTIMLSNNAYLAGIQINNEPLKDFSPQKFNYEYLLTFGSSDVPNLSYVKGDENQEVSVAKNPLGEKSYIYVTSEDGKTTNVYAVLFKPTTENPGDFPSKDDVCLIYLGGGSWRASCCKNAVSIAIYTPQGAIIYKGNVPLANPNLNLCESDMGLSFNIQQKGIFVYAFIYNNKKVFHSDKINNW